MSSKRSYRYRVVDVFTETPLEGNPLAVFLDASDMDGDLMQKIAREMNLSETTFILPATRGDCAAQVRIFTPTVEMVFAGHPTIGTSFVLLDEGIVPRDPKNFLLEEKVGPVPIQVEPGDRPLIWLTTPSIQQGRTYDRAICAQALGLDTSDLLEVEPQLFSAGNPNIYIPLKTRELVDRAWVDSASMRLLKVPGEPPHCVFVFTPTAEGAYSRMFAPELGVSEDPATGSATGPLAAYMIWNKLVSGADGTNFISEQGTKMGRRSILHVRVRGDKGSAGIDVGGYVTPLVQATLTL